MAGQEKWELSREDMRKFIERVSDMYKDDGEK